MVIKQDIWMDIYQCNRTLHIYLPKNYKYRKCGVIYMFDGHNLFNDKDSTYGTSWGLKDFMDETDPNVIIVGLECNHGSTLRLCEFSPYSFEDDHWGIIEASGKELSEWMVRVLIPYVEDQFNVYRDAYHRAIGGSSMGGLMAVYIGSVYHDIFGKTIALSSYFQHVYQRLKRDIEPIGCNGQSTFYISYGGMEVDDQHWLADYTAKTLELTRIMSDHGATIRLYCYPQADHSESAWAQETQTWMDELHIWEW